MYDLTFEYGYSQNWVLGLFHANLLEAVHSATRLTIDGLLEIPNELSESPVRSFLSFYLCLESCCMNLYVRSVWNIIYSIWTFGKAAEVHKDHPQKIEVADLNVDFMFSLVRHRNRICTMCPNLKRLITSNTSREAGVSVKFKKHMKMSRFFCSICF
jgi:hypothetical protein